MLVRYEKREEEEEEEEKREREKKRERESAERRKRLRIVCIRRHLLTGDDGESMLRYKAS